jgi:DNA primase
MAGGGYDVEEVRRRADIVEVISPHVNLRKAGKRLTGLCPFHQERSASFSVDPEKGLWYCFGCRAGGDVFRFVEMMERVEFSEAVELLARRYNVRPLARAGGAQQQQRERLLALHQQAAAFFRSCLARPAAAPARAYLERRGLSPQAIEDFAIGYAPPAWDALLNAMAKQGYPGEELARAGLAVARDSGNGHYDRFRDRIIFPIWDASGRVIAFGGRSMADDQPPKYLNSPETPLFQKGRTLYAFHRARRAMDAAGRAIIVEGYLDAIACHEAEFAETVATLGTALTPEHVEMLRRRVPLILLSFDADSAGMAAALRGRELFQQAGLTVKVLSLPEKTDPDQLVRERGAEAFQGLVEAAVPIIEWELARILARSGGVGEAQRMDVFREAAAALARVPPGVEREYYIRWLAQQWAPEDPSHAASMETGIREEVSRHTARRPQPGRRTEQPRAPEGGGAPPPARPGTGHAAANLLAALLQDDDLARRYAGALEADDFPHQEQQEIFRAIRALVSKGLAVKPAAVAAEIEGGAKRHLAELAMRETPAERVQELVERGVRRMVEGRLLRRHGELLRRLGEVGPGSEQEAIRSALNECAEELGKLRGQRVMG